ncbi:hypothetical protein COCMIDRAFT_2285 [Bipolaris oryzae ATCC 44560]|uniref:PNPLA domain-containing protein n=1 Tax=Bipolaris oryzae ATCC 44560 TaxID=930090 RepID=W6ZG20_COCMI|nr:uncharacterized protein COCMIDRAFT_2285 [Bipolaris oryzae ATCC 44560]EUC48828.1 hypothetical protein COCMIDRAFT_2285 [Bipolaris oryzae ATCC 44560]
MSTSNPKWILDGPNMARPSSHGDEILVSHTSKADIFRPSTKDHRSVSTSTSRKLNVFREQVPTYQEASDDDESSSAVCDSCSVHTQPIWNCSYCDMNFCDDCWGKQGPHKLGRKGPDGLPHEKANPTIVQRLKDILAPPQDYYEQQILHVEDEDTTWFGIARDNHNKSILDDRGRYAAIMADSNTDEYQFRYPQIVSFVGQTGAGKSTLIKMLIDQQERIHGSREWVFPSPVVGSMTNSNIPTSCDVHLYSDPTTYLSEYPMLFADCEGLEGGENTPISAQYREKASHTSEEKGKGRDMRREYPKLQKISRGLNRTRLEIKWANSPEKTKRQYAVTEFYPRLLYTFSDVVVFVLRNAKTFESTVLTLLIKWARSSIEKSVNQPILPHAIIALNAASTKVDHSAWDPEHATESLLADVAGAVDRDPAFKELKEYWIRKGRNIHTVKDLLLCYYSSITVVRIPGDGRYMMIDEQIQKLHDTLSKRCRESFNMKRKSRMLFNSDSLNVYLHSAFEHFSNDLNKPFDFINASFKINPIPLNFGGNILKLAVAMKARYDDPTKIFEELSFMVASCIGLDCVRQNFKGPADRILEKQYRSHCEAALEDFCAFYWPCTFSYRHRSRCVNVKALHSKGHQNKKGEIIGTGPYESDFTFSGFAKDWNRHLQNHLAQFQVELSSQLMETPSASEVDITTRLHHDNITTFYKRLGGAQKFVSHLTCYCCLRELAEHPLRCGHVLCTPCIKSYGKPHTELKHSYAMASCPLHHYETVSSAHWPVHFKPPLAGVRVLSLDGGGMRGIVILDVLREIQKELGGRIPVQDFFDLIVGTSTGGLLALGLGVKNWSIEQSTRTFLNLVGNAFTTRYPGGFQFMRSKYKTKPLQSALLQAFGDEAMFGGVPEDMSGSARKVAVTAATETGEEVVIFTNYNRTSKSGVGYRLVRPDDPNNGLKVREAARATSAAPLFFKPFVNDRTKESYIDGAVKHNNPVRIANTEAKFLWPDVEERYPDILLSVGTGYHESGVEGSSPTGSDRRRMQVRKALDLTKKRSKISKVFPSVDSWYQIAKKRIEDILNSEKIWRDFRTDVVGLSSPIAAERYMRMNPQVRSPVPKMDDTSKINDLQREVADSLRTPESQGMIRTIAGRLIASSFYFEKIGRIRESRGVLTVQGTIACRFANGSDNLRFLGEHIRFKFQRYRFQPFFRIYEVGNVEHTQEIELSRNVLEDMVDTRLFDLGPIVIPVTSESALLAIDLHLTDDHMQPTLSTGFPISGFPRNLTEGETAIQTEFSAALASLPMPDTEPLKILDKRRSLRESRSNIHNKLALEHRPLSDGNINYGPPSTLADSHDPVSDGAHGHSETTPQPPTPTLPLDPERRVELHDPDEAIGMSDAEMAPSHEERGGPVAKKGASKLTGHDVDAASEASLSWETLM